jgi:hypothetical protein
MRLLDARFKYTPSTSTNIVTTWKRHGYKPTTEAERQARQRRALGETTREGSVVQIDGAKHAQLSALRLAPRKSAVASTADANRPR